MSLHDSFSELAGRLRSGDEGASAEVFRRFQTRLVALARSRLEERIRRKEDPEDVVQSVYRSFFVRFRDGRLAPRTWDELWGLLTWITICKCRSRAAFFRTARRDVAAEVSAASADEIAALIDREPTPEEGATLAEAVERVMSGLDSEDREVVSMALQGYTVPEIAERVGRAERTVRRFIRERVRGRLLRMQAELI
ncbi:MAG TPA: sigma-70 family RNA polymerase sigma factor [Isosphaeraceae bacterium]|jgi:RNA polymerase sigma-70 factor (ECF subfamily)|nr:sigma-70 family RNA polymerase sigma factor [Isosphaeraceae bacterium]